MVAGLVGLKGPLKRGWLRPAPHKQSLSEWGRHTHRQVGRDAHTHYHTQCSIWTSDDQAAQKFKVGAGVITFCHHLHLCAPHLP